MLERHICCEVWGLAVAVPPLLVFHREDVEALKEGWELTPAFLSLQQQFPG